MFNKFSSRGASSLFMVALLSILSACGGGGSGSSSPSTPVTPPAPVAATLNLTASAATVKSDNSDATTITVTAVTATNAAVSGIAVSLAADSGVLSTGSATTDSTGRATFTLSSGASAVNRTITVTATAGTVTSQIPINVIGSTVDLASNTTSLLIGGGSATLTATVKNAAGTPIANTVVTFSANSGTTVTPTTATTNASGVATAQVTGTAAGASSVAASAAGFTRTLAYTISGASTFGITTTVPAAINRVVALSLVGGPPATATLLVNVTAPSGTTVVFVSTSGTWSSNNAAQASVVSVNGTATNTLRITNAGVANIQVYDAANSTVADTLTASVTSAIANATKITLQATPSVVAPSSGGTTGVASLTATVTDANNQPVGGATVAFQIVNPTGGGETISPAVAQTLRTATSTQALGQAKATFNAGSLPSGAQGVQIRATVVDVPTVFTGNGSSGNNATVVIGGTAGSVTIGRSTVIQEAANQTAYVLDMSVLVADSNGNPVANTTVSLSAWPIAWAPGGACSPGTYYYNEDINEDLNLDPQNEDGVRYVYAVPRPSTFTIGTKDQQATPPNSASGTLPATVTTDASGLASFKLTYTKSNALFIKARIKATTLVQGTETVGQTVFTLPALLTDIGPPCLLPASPYSF